MEGAIDGLVARPNKSAVLLLTCWRYLVFGGCGFDAYRKDVWTLRRRGLPRQGTDRLLVGVAIYFVGGLCCIGYFLYRVT